MVQRRPQQALCRADDFINAPGSRLSWYRRAQPAHWDREKKHVGITKEPNQVGGFAVGYATVDTYTSVPLKRVVLQAHAQETLSKMSAHTMFSFFKYVTENRAVIA